nr:hypothetical protein CFP56_24328 [Quercus suber]
MKSSSAVFRHRLASGRMPQTPFFMLTPKSPRNIFRPDALISSEYLLEKVPLSEINILPSGAVLVLGRGTSQQLFLSSALPIHPCIYHAVVISVPPSTPPTFLSLSFPFPVLPHSTTYSSLSFSSSSSHLIIIMRHLQPRALEPTLDVEPLIRLRAVEDGLVAAGMLCDEIEGLDDTQTQLLALLILGDRDILDVAYESEMDDEDVIAAGAAGAHLVEAGFEFMRGDVADVREDAQHVQETGAEIGALERSDRVAGGQRGGDGGGDEGGAEEWGFACFGGRGVRGGGGHGVGWDECVFSSVLFCFENPRKRFRELRAEDVTYLGCNNSSFSDVKPIMSARASLPPGSDLQFLKLIERRDPVSALRFDHPQARRHTIYITYLQSSSPQLHARKRGLQRMMGVIKGI